MQRCLRRACGRAASRPFAAPSRWAWAAFLATFGLGHAADGREIPGPTSADEARREAISAIPLARIAPESRGEVEGILRDPSLYRRLPTSVVECRPAMLTYLVENPEVLVEIWRQLGISKVRMQRIDATHFHVSDGAGASGVLTVAEQQCDADAQNRLTLLVDGQYEGPPFQRPLRAKCVLLLRSGSLVESNGRPFVAARLDAFVKFDRTSLELVARLTQPLLGTTADRNFTDTMKFVSNFSLTAEHRPEAIDRLAEELETVDPPRRAELVRVAFECAEQGRRWHETRQATALDPVGLQAERR